MRATGILGIFVFGALAGGTFLVVRDIDRRAEEEARLRARIAHIMSETRTARIIVDRKVEDHPDGRPRLHLRWSPIGADGKALSPEAVREIEVVGEIVYFDAFQIVFEADDIRDQDPLRGKTLTLFSRVFGEHQAPADGIPLELPDELAAGDAAPRVDFVPPAFRAQAGEAGELERELWGRFWDLCRDPEYAAEQRVRTAQGTAVSKLMLPDHEYTITVSPEGQILISHPEPVDPLSKRE